MRPRTTTMAGLTACAGGAVALTAMLAGDAPASAPAPAPACVPATNIQAIIDDSGSMRSSDRNKLRVQGLKLLIAQQSNAGRTLGAFEFGSTANRVFAPALIGGNQAAMGAALDASTDADNGGTDYDEGFAGAVADNPGADARIFLTDGGNNGTYADSHRLPRAGTAAPPKTYVVGLDIGPAEPSTSGSERDGARLQRIATETGGRYFPSVTQANIQSRFNTISALLGCEAAPTELTFPTFSRPGQKIGRTQRLGPRTRFVDVLLNWGAPGNRFTIGQVTAYRGAKPLASTTGRATITFRGKSRTRKVRKLRPIRRITGTTFGGYTIVKPKAATRLRVIVGAGRLADREAPNAQVKLRQR